MKKYLYLLALSFSSVAVNAQGTVGLIAHWNFNGNANDISGNGLNGVVNGATLAAGYSGTANSAYHFSGPGVAGIVDHIYVPYDNLMNVETYSLCALVKFDDFSADNCQTSSILWRGTQGADDYYSLYVNDNTYDASCATVTKTKNSLLTDMGNTAWTIPGSARTYSFYTDTAQWYCVVITYDGTQIKTYIDGNLYKTLSYNVPLQPGSESMRLGASMFSVNNNDWRSYPLYGSIDDIKLYGRSLAASEVDMYCEEAKSGGGGDPGNGGGGDNGGGTDWPTSVAGVSVNNMGVAPNPATDKIQVFMQAATKGKIQLLNTVGQILAEKAIEGSSMQFDLNNYASGLYMIRLETANGKVSVSKFIKN